MNDIKTELDDYDRHDDRQRGGPKNREEFFKKRAIMDHVKKHGVTKVAAMPHAEREAPVRSRRARWGSSPLKDKIGNVVSHLDGPPGLRMSIEQGLRSNEVAPDNEDFEYDLEVELEGSDDSEAAD